jgi:type II secretory pathway component PulJ
MRRQFIREEGGFTLPEMLVSITFMIVMLFALYSVFDMSIRVYGFGIDKLEATENARLGLEKLARGLRTAYPYDKVNEQEHLFWTSANPATPALPTSSSVTFGNDVNADRKIDVATEPITYSLSGNTLQRNGQPAVDFVQNAPEVVGPALSFQYLDANGNTVTSGNEADIAWYR